MSRTAKLAPACALAFASLQSPLRADEYTVDPSHTSVIFGISHLGYSFTYGRFNKVSGDFTLDPAKPESASFTLAIDAASFLPKRNGSLFFQAAGRDLVTSSILAVERPEREIVASYEN